MKPVSTTLTHLAERVRVILDGDPRITEKTMFGGLSFLLNGHILVACNKDGRILLSVGKEHFEEALKRPGAYQMHMGERPMTGFIAVSEEGTADDDALKTWIAYAMKFAETLPPK